MLIKHEEALIHIPVNEPFRFFLREESGRRDLIVTTAESEYEIIHGIGEGAGDEFSEVVCELYTRMFFQKIEEAVFGTIKTIDVIAVYAEIFDYLESLVEKKEGVDYGDNRNGIS